jgi:hypothetical protein
MVEVFAQWHPLGLCAGIFFDVTLSAIPSNGSLNPSLPPSVHCTGV